MRLLAISVCLIVMSASGQAAEAQPEVKAEIRSVLNDCQEQRAGKCFRTCGPLYTRVIRNQPYSTSELDACRAAHAEFLETRVDSNAEPDPVTAPGASERRASRAQTMPDVAGVFYATNRIRATDRPDWRSKCRDTIAMQDRSPVPTFAEGTQVRVTGIRVTQLQRGSREFACTAESITAIDSQ
ncbi:MAG: hypothetical protein AAGE85_12155 [Pseudomonadota bacterium]